MLGASELARASGEQRALRWDNRPLRSLRPKALAALAALVLVAASTGTGLFLHAGRPAQLAWTKSSLALARLEPCWNGSLRLVVAPSVAHVGEVIALDAEGPTAARVIGGVSTTLEARSPRGWSAYDYLWTAPGGPDQEDLGSALANAGEAMILVGFQGRVFARVPDVPAATYRLVRHYGAIPPSHLRRGGANLCAGLTVLPTASPYVPTGVPTVKVSPSSGLSGGEEVGVTLSGFGASSLVHLSECAFGALATPDGCPAGTGRGEPVRLGDNGSSTTIFRAQSAATALPGTRAREYPCASNCVLVATLGPAYASAGAPLSFKAPGASGTLDEVGGPSPGLGLGVPGQVSFIREGPRHERVYDAETAPDGEFSITVPPGRYQVSGSSPLVSSDGRPVTCFATPLVVKVSQRVPSPAINVTCSVK